MCVCVCVWLFDPQQSNDALAWNLFLAGMCFPFFSFCFISEEPLSLKLKDTTPNTDTGEENDPIQDWGHGHSFWSQPLLTGSLFMLRTNLNTYFQTNILFELNRGADVEQIWNKNDLQTLVCLRWLSWTNSSENSVHSAILTHSFFQQPQALLHQRSVFLASF